MATHRTEILSERFRWHSDKDQIEDIGSHVLRPASDYSAKVDVYEDRVRSWFLDVAAREAGDEMGPGDYVALAVALAYLEGVEQYRRGEVAPGGERGRWFEESAARVFSSVRREALKSLWKAVRCGLFHSGFTEGPVLVSRRSTEALREADGFLHINPTTFVRDVVEDFAGFVRALREHPRGTLGRNFERLWDRRWEATEPPNTAMEPTARESSS